MDWHQQPDESNRAYEAFRVYCSIGADRTLEETARLTRLGKRTIARYSKKYSWSDRTRAFIAHQEQTTEQIFESVVRANVAEEAAKWAKRRQEFREECFELGQKLIERGKHLLRFPAEKVAKTESEDGKTVTTIIKPSRWNMNSIANLLRLATELSMLSTGLAPGTHPLDEVDWETVSSEDLDKILRDVNLKQ